VIAFMNLFDTKYLVFSKYCYFCSRYVICKFGESFLYYSNIDC